MEKGGNSINTYEVFYASSQRKPNGEPVVLRLWCKSYTLGSVMLAGRPLACIFLIQNPAP